MTKTITVLVIVNDVFDHEEVAMCLDFLDAYPKKVIWRQRCADNLQHWGGPGYTDLLSVGLMALHVIAKRALYSVAID